MPIRARRAAAVCGPAASAAAVDRGLASPARRAPSCAAAAASGGSFPRLLPVAVRSTHMKGMSACTTSAAVSITVGRVFRQHRLDDHPKVLRARLGRVRVPGGPRRGGGDHLGRSARGERRLTGEQVIERRAEVVNIGPVIGFGSEQLLRGDVIGGSHHRPGPAGCVWYRNPRRTVPVPGRGSSQCRQCRAAGSPA